MSESELKLAVRQYLDLQRNMGHLWYERLNSGKAWASYTDTKGETRRYQLNMCREGTADFILARPVNQQAPYKGLQVIFIETKGKGRQTPKQKEFQQEVESLGADYYLVKELNELIKIIGGA